MTVGMGFLGFGKHLARLQSWREWERTSVFLAVYATAWVFDYLFPSVLIFLMILILYPQSRTVCFPLAPPALIDSKTGGIQKPAAGVLASDTSMTGAPEKHPGEAVEQEAHNFVTSISTVSQSLPKKEYLFIPNAKTMQLAFGTAAGKNREGNVFYI
jgi:hypothetical protein